MVLRFLIRILANNEQLVKRLSESYPMRRAAQYVVRIMYHGKGIIEENDLKRKLKPEEFRLIISKFSKNLQKQIKDTHEQFKRKMQ